MEQSTQGFMAGAMDVILENGLKLIIGLTVLWLGWKIIKLIVKKFESFLDKRGIDVTVKSFLQASASVGLKVGLVIFIVLPIMGIPAASFAALVASAGVAIGLALQGSLSNLAGGVVILMMRPFKVGDFIEIGAYSGTVDSIKIFHTELLTPDNKLVLIPSATVANGSLINYTAKEKRRVDLVFGVGYEQDIFKVKAILTEIVQQHDLIIDTPDNFVGLSEHAASSLNFVIRAWCETGNYWKVYFDLIEQVKIRFDEENISIPFPQMDVHVVKED